MKSLKYCLLYVLFVHLVVAIDYEIDYDRMRLISRLINETLRDPYYPTREPNFERLELSRSTIADLCQDLPFQEKKRQGCCVGHQVKYIYNSKLEFNQITVYNAKENYKNLPPIQSSQYQQEIRFQLPIKKVNEDFNKANCKSFYDGTLHVFKRSTVHNVYHGGRIKLIIFAIIMIDFIFLSN